MFENFPPNVNSMETFSVMNLFFKHFTRAMSDVQEILFHTQKSLFVRMIITSDDMMAYIRSQGLNGCL